MEVGIVTDSASNIPSAAVAELGIHVVPMILKFGEREIRDGVDHLEGGFYRLLVDEGVPASTSAPSTGDFAEAYERALGSADAVVCSTVASFASATFDAASAAARDFGDRVRVIDSRSASLGEGFPVIEAARAARAGGSLAEVVARIEEVIARTALVATIDTFEFLRKSGRVNVVQAYAATALNIKPVFAFRGGKLEQLGRPRTRARAIERVVEEARLAGERGPLHLGIVHADRPEEAADLRARIESVAATEEVLVSEFTPLMGSHTGPGVLGAAYW